MHLDLLKSDVILKSNYNPHKTTMVALTSMKIFDVQNNVFFGLALTYSEDVKHFGIYFDSKWN